jgi:hypothetical protein
LKKMLFAVAVLATLACTSRAQTTRDTHSTCSAFASSGNLWCSDVVINQAYVGDTDPTKLNTVSLYVLVNADGSLSNGNISFLYGVTDTNPYGNTVDEPATGTFTPCSVNCGPIVVSGDTQTVAGDFSLTFSGQFSGTWTFTLVRHRKLAVGGRGGGWRFWTTETGTFTYTQQ